jgi:hypothetical protein
MTRPSRLYIGIVAGLCIVAIGLLADEPEKVTLMVGSNAMPGNQPVTATHIRIVTIEDSNESRETINVPWQRTSYAESINLTVMSASGVVACLITYKGKPVSNAAGTIAVCSYRKP